MIDNGIDWVRLIHEWWPIATWVGGVLFGRGVTRHFTAQHLRAQRRQIHNQQLLISKLADDNQRIIDYTNHLITEERNGRRN